MVCYSKSIYNSLILNPIIKIDEYVNILKNNSNHAIFNVYEELLMNFIWKKTCIYRNILICYASN